MGASDSFNIESALNDWLNYNCSTEDMTPADTRDMKEHMLCTVQELVEEKELSEEEAFAIAKIRFGSKEDWADEMQTVNEKNFQLKKIIILLGGVFAFFFANYFVLCLDKVILLILNYLNGPSLANAEVAKYIIKVSCLFTIFLFVAAFFMHSPLLWIMNKLKLRFSFIISFIIVVFSLVIFDWYLVIKISSSIKDIYMKNTLFYAERNFKYYYLLIWGIGYIVLFLRYFKKFEK